MRHKSEPKRRRPLPARTRKRQGQASGRKRRSFPARVGRIVAVVLMSLILLLLLSFAVIAGSFYLPQMIKPLWRGDCPPELGRQTYLTSLFRSRAEDEKAVIEWLKAQDGRRECRRRLVTSAAATCEDFYVREKDRSGQAAVVITRDYCQAFSAVPAGPGRQGRQGVVGPGCQYLLAPGKVPSGPEAFPRNCPGFGGAPLSLLPELQRPGGAEPGVPPDLRLRPSVKSRPFCDELSVADRAGRGMAPDCMDRTGTRARSLPAGSF